MFSLSRPPPGYGIPTLVDMNQRFDVAAHDQFIEVGHIPLRVHIDDTARLNLVVAARQNPAIRVETGTARDIALGDQVELLQQVGGAKGGRFANGDLTDKATDNCKSAKTETHPGSPNNQLTTFVC